MTKGRDVPPRIDWINRLGKWRMVLVGRLLGTRPDTDPQTIGYRKLIDQLHMRDLECAALLGLLIDKGVLTSEEVTIQMQRAARERCEKYEREFPGFTATDVGISVDVAKAAETTKGWPL